jgi:hypothetical protein
MYLSPHYAFFCYALMLILIDKVTDDKYQYGMEVSFKLYFFSSGIKEFMKRFLFGLLFFGLSVSLSSSALARDFYLKNPALDIERYQFYIELSDQSDLIKGRALISLRTLSPLQEFALDLASQTEGMHGMQVLQVKAESRRCNLNM